MTDHKPLPRCPYCGGEMDYFYSYIFEKHYYICSKCRASSPVTDRELESYTAAMQRYVEPNRVLTLGEVQVLAYAEYEQQHVISVEYRVIINGAENVFRPCVVAHESLSMVGILELYNGANMKLMEKSMYGKSWRCWLRKPTQKEMEAVAWETK